MLWIKGNLVMILKCVLDLSHIRKEQPGFIAKCDHGVFKKFEEISTPASSPQPLWISFQFYVSQISHAHSTARKRFDPTCFFHFFLETYSNLLLNLFLAFVSLDAYVKTEINKITVCLHLLASCRSIQFVEPFDIVYGWNEQNRPFLQRFAPSNKGNCQNFSRFITGFNKNLLIVLSYWSWNFAPVTWTFAFSLPLSVPKINATECNTVARLSLPNS